MESKTAAQTHTLVTEEWRRTDQSLFQVDETQTSSDEAGFSVDIEPLAPEWIQKGVILTDLETASKQFPDLVKRYLFQSGRPERGVEAFDLHQAQWKQGIFCYVPEGIILEQPLKTHISPVGSPTAIFPHVLIVAEAGAQFTLLDERSGQTGADQLISNEVVEIFVKPNATVKTIRYQHWGDSVLELFGQRTILDRDAVFNHLVAGLGTSVTKANIETILSESGSRCELLGILLEKGTQHFDFHTLQDHRAPNTYSNLLYKSALGGQSEAIYTGLIRVTEAGTGTDAFQANRNLLLSQGAKADSVPMLEIETDDVRCTHGVATGPIDEDQLFYLMSRGMTPETAEQLIVEGFFEEAINLIHAEPIKELLMQEVRNQLPEAAKGVQ